MDIIIIGIGVGIGLIASTFIASSMYRIVPPSEAHLVVTPKGRMVVSPDEEVATDGKKTYFEIPSFVPFIGRVVRKMDVTTKELIGQQETYEKDQARYNVKWSLKYRINDVKTAAETFINDEELREQLKEVVESSVRATTVLYSVIDARSKKKEIENKINQEMVDDLQAWGLKLVNFQLVDFTDTESSSIISDISKRREVEIEATTREQNAEKWKQARLKEAESEEIAKQREIEKDQRIGEQDEKKKQKIAIEAKLAQQKEYEVLEVQTIRQAEIDKGKAIVKAEELKATEAIKKDQKKLEGEGDRIRSEEQAKGNAAHILQNGLAEAQAKDALQKALKQFDDNAIRALVAEKIVDKDKTVGIATAEALKQAEVKLFSGGNDSKQGFNLASMIESASMGNVDTAASVMNRIARPNDLGFNALAAIKADEINQETKKKVKKDPTKK